MEKRKILYIAFILLLISGCKDDVLLDDTPINKDGSIAFRADSIFTRGTPQTDLTAYNTVNLIAYSHTGNYDDQKSLYRQIVLNKGNGGNATWDYSPHMFWPDGHKLSFLAHASDAGYASASGNDGVFIDGDPSTGAPTIEYIVPQDVTKQPDLLVTALLNLSKVNNVILPMKHALACVSFCATGLPNMRVKSITLKNVYRKATLALDNTSIKWTIDPDSKGLTALEPGIKSDESLTENPINKNYLMTENGYLMMIPQALTDAYIDVTYWKGTAGTERKTTYPLPTTVVWEPGKKYIYKFGDAADEVVVYYEKYADNSYGFQSKNSNFNALDDTKTIVEAGYGVLSKSRLVSTNPKIQLGSSSTPISAIKVSSVSGEYSLYAISQTGIAGTNTFVLPDTHTPVDLYFDSNSVPCGKIIPHFAKGVSDWNPSDNTFPIRTPQQMRNLSALTKDDPFVNATYGKVFKQERDIDFSGANSSIGGGVLNGAVVDQTFSGKYEGQSKSISNVTISAAGSDYVGLFSKSIDQLNNIVLKSASIVGQNNVGGIVGYSYGTNAAINRPRIIGLENVPAKQINITGVSYVGGIVGRNGGKIEGNVSLEPATEITVAEVSGWINIKGTGDRIGGITGYNEYGSSIKTVLVNGVFVTGTNLGNLIESKITITGRDYVGGIVGQNDTSIEGNVTGSGSDIKNMPDVAGIIEITGGSRVGGIAGANASTGNLNSVNIRLGRAPAMIIKGTGSNIGGIVGENSGTLGVLSNNTFISTRGNIEISGADNVGGIVGANISSAQLENCFVYDFYTQGTTKEYYAPKIVCTGSNAGGIAGQNAASIYNCSVFSANSNVLLSITSANNNAGGIAGANTAGAKTEKCSLIGKILIEAKVQAAGGVYGDNKSSTTIKNCWVGSSDNNKILADASSSLGLVISAPGVAPSFGAPTITGTKYIGGIVGLSDGGVIENITLSDNITIGRADVVGGDGSNSVGGIVGGISASYQGQTNVIRGCKVINTTGKRVFIQGTSNLGGIAGLSNGFIENCEVSGTQTVPLVITGLGTIGGIVGQNGGHSDIYAGTVQYGNEYTIIKNCKVTGYLNIKGSDGTWSMATQVGGIVGLNGQNKVNNVDGCVVKGNAAGAIVISVGGNTGEKKGTSGGIVGTNNGYVHSCDVQNTIIKSLYYYAGGIAGQTTSTATIFTPPSGYRSDIDDCRVCSGVAITGLSSGTIAPGALIGYLDSSVGITLGNTSSNQVNNSGITVNGLAPALDIRIAGYITGGAVIKHSITAVSPRNIMIRKKGK